MDEVAQRARYTKEAVYSNFPSKEDLFFAVYERRVERALTEVVPGLRQAGAEQAFGRLATATIERRGRDDGWLAVFSEFWERFAAVHARLLEPLADAVRQLVGLRLPLRILVTATGSPVPAGQPGARLPVTNLYNLVQPLLRFEVTAGDGSVTVSGR